VLLDVHLPFINRLNIFEIIRKDFPDKKIIICSALQKEEQQSLINGVDGYYCKKEDLEGLVEKVGKIMDNKSRLGELRENEKRNFRRIPVNIFASCQKGSHRLLPDSARFFSYTKDLSLQGGRFVIAEDLQEGQHFSAFLELPTNFLPLLVDCEVMWVKKLGRYDLKAKRNNEVGVRFVKLDPPQDEEKLKNYLSFA
jgi:CheY-like chemotaxis protein